MPWKYAAPHSRSAGFARSNGWPCCCVETADDFRGAGVPKFDSAASGPVVPHGAERLPSEPHLVSVSVTMTPTAMPFTTAAAAKVSV